MTELYDLETDPLRMHNLTQKPKVRKIRRKLDDSLRKLLVMRNDDVHPATSYSDWYDNQRQVIRNAHGALNNPEDQPDWSLLVDHPLRQH